MRNSQLVIFAILASFVVSFALYSSLPNTMASHWSLSGAVDGYSSKSTAAFLIPVASLVILAIFWAIPKIDPLSKNISHFRDYFDGMLLSIVLFMFYIHTLTILWNLGFVFDMGQFLSPAFGALFCYFGVILEHIEMNWFVGIRTPWTMSSKRVWQKTHKVASKTFKLAGILAAGAFFVPRHAVFLIVVPVIFAVVYSAIFSYFEYQKKA